MNGLLLEAFRHSAWATGTLIAELRQQPAEVLERPARGYGSVIDTLNHVVRSDAGYAVALGAERPAWLAPGAMTTDLDTLQDRADEVAQTWERLLAEPLDGERLLLLDAGAFECRASIVVAQALHHACAHREQVRGGLADSGVKVKDLQPWEYSLESGRARVLPEPH